MSNKNVNLGSWVDVVDALDLQLIRCLQDNPRAPYSAIGRLVGVSETTVKRRIDDLIARGLIRPAMIADIMSLGYDTRAYLYFKVEPSAIQSVADTLCAYPETLSVGLITGRFDVISLVLLRSAAELPQFLAKRIAPIAGILYTETAICPDMPKAFADWRLPLEGELAPDDRDDSDEASRSANHVGVIAGLD